MAVFQLLPAEGVVILRVLGVLAMEKAALKPLIDVSEALYILIRYSPEVTVGGMVQ